MTTREKECARLEARQWIRKEAQRWPRDRERDIRESGQRCKDNAMEAKMGEGKNRQYAYSILVNGLPKVVVRY